MTGRGRGVQPPRSNVPPAQSETESTADVAQPHSAQDPRPPQHEVLPAHVVEGIGRVTIGRGRGREHHPGTVPGLLPQMGSDPFPGWFLIIMCLGVTVQGCNAGADTLLLPLPNSKLGTAAPMMPLGVGPMLRAPTPASSVTESMTFANQPCLAPAGRGRGRGRGIVASDEGGEVSGAAATGMSSVTPVQSLAQPTPTVTASAAGSGSGTGGGSTGV